MPLIFGFIGLLGLVGSFGLLAFLGFIELVELGFEVLDEAGVHFGNNFSLIVHLFKIIL
jgi:hypothetical protein